MLKGDRVALRAIEENDLPQLMEWRNEPIFRRYFRETAEINMLQQRDWFKNVSERGSLNKMFAIVDVNSGELYGACGLCYIDWINRSADFSIYIGYNDLYIDQILAGESALLMKDYAFNVLNLHRLWAEIYSIDERKKEFFKSLDFTLDGTFRQTYWYNGKWHDSLFFSLLSSDEIH